MTSEELVAQVDRALREVLDPETGINIVDMGLVYGVEADAEAGRVTVTITFTTPACPAGDALIAGIERRLDREPEIKSLDVKVSFEPRWSPDRITAEGRASLGWQE